MLGHEFESTGFVKLVYPQKDIIADLLDKILYQAKKIYDYPIRNLKDFSVCYQKHGMHPAFYNLVNHIPAFFDIANNSVILKTLRTLGGQSVLINKEHSGFRFDFPEKEATRFRPHQDTVYNYGGLKNITLWMPLMETTRELGSLIVYHDSDKEGIIPFYKDDRNKMVIEESRLSNYRTEELYLKEGEFLLMKQTLVHASGANRAKIPRVTVLARYSFLEDKSWAERGYAPEPLTRSVS